VVGTRPGSAQDPAQHPAQRRAAASAPVPPASGAASAGAQAAAAYLRELLLRPGRFQRRWEQYVERSRRGQINQLAVAEVLAHYLWEHPRNAGDADILPRQLKDTSSRALSGKLLSRATLALFMDAFDLPDAERDQLIRLWEGTGRVRVPSGPRAMRPEVVSEVAAILGPPAHQTVSLHDHVHIGSDRRPLRTRTLQVIEAIGPGLDRIPYIYDTNALTITTGQGLRGIAEPLARIQEDVYASHLLLADELAVGDTLTLEYWTSYQYPERYPGPDDREYRRVVMRQVPNIDIRVEFEASMLPAKIWWAVWDGMQGDVADDQEVVLDSQHSVHKYLRLAERTVVGFQWEW
jgi:hypothetical protein